MTNSNALPDVQHGRIPVDSGHLLIVDPAHLPADLLRRLVQPNEFGVRAALQIATPSGDGWYDVVGEEGALAILDPNYKDGDEPWGTE
jgi:hypothetical protein